MKKIAIAAIVGILLIGGVLPVEAATAPTKPTTTQKVQLQYLVEEEKLARDVYAYLAANVTSQKFSNITRSEQMHMDTLSALLKKYGISNPVLTRSAGVFKDAKLQALYNSLTAQGSAGVAAAFEVGVSIEKLDIADLQKMMTTNAPTDIQSAWSLLLSGSQNHLAAFNR